MDVVRTPDQFEAELASYLYERSEEARAVRVGEKETSEQAAIVERYADLFTREQHEALRRAKEQARGEERERLYRLRESAAGGFIARELAEDPDNEIEASDATTVSYAWSNVRLYVTSSALGTQFSADLKLTTDGVECGYQVIGMYPYIECGKEDPANQVRAATGCCDRARWAASCPSNSARHESLTGMPLWRASSVLRSTGKPKVSYRRNSSAPVTPVFR